MNTPLRIPEIAILPSELSANAPDINLYAWKMKVYEESVFDSYDHGDLFDSVEEALAHACSVFQNLVNHRHLFPSNIEQEFKVTITKKTDSSAQVGPGVGLPHASEKAPLNLVQVAKNQAPLAF